jgi:hypothetical protein
MIVKIQRSIVPRKMMLIYGEDREPLYHGPADREVERLMGDRLKAYFEVRLERNGEMVIEHEAEPQPW